METNICLVHCSVPDEKIAKKLAHFLVTTHLAACVKQISNVLTTYEWDGQLEHNQQTLLLIKTTITALKSVQSAILEHHPDECPEIITTPVSSGYGPYISWVEQQIDLSNRTETF